MADREEMPDHREVPVSVILPPGTVGQYATNMIVQHTDHEFYVYFFQARPPLIMGSAQVQRAQVAAIEAIPSECVGFVIIAADRMEAFVATLQASLEKFHAMFRQREVSS